MNLLPLCTGYKNRKNKDFAGNSLGRVWRELSDLKEREHRIRPLNI